jgi:hypothetical protein
MTPAEKRRLLELAKIGVEHQHELNVLFDRFAGHEGQYTDCLHPDCALVRTLSVPSEEPKHD